MVPPNDLLKRMEALNRRPLKDRPAEDAETESSAGTPSKVDRRPPRRSSRASRPAQAPAMPTTTLDDLPNCVEAISADAGPALVFTTDVDTYDDACAGLSERFRAQIDDEGSSFQRNVARRGDLNISGIEDVLFIDLETTGLMNTPVFLIGAMVWTDAGLSVRQYFARNLDEEHAILSIFAEHISPRTWLVTFNGKTFDWPFVLDRSLRHGVDMRFHGAHVDLLHVGRRAWGDSTPNCKLQTLEQYICDRTRVGDIPSSEIPAAYRRFTRSEDATEMQSVLHHNALDLITLADLIVRLPEDISVPQKRRRSRRRRA